MVSTLLPAQGAATFRRPAGGESQYGGTAIHALQSEYSMLYYKISIKRPFSKEEITHALQNCGKELPIAGKFCPFCGAAVEQTGVNDETAVFTTLPDDMKDPVETGPIDTSAFDAAMRAEKQQLPVDDTAADPLADTQSQYSESRKAFHAGCHASDRHAAGPPYCGHARASHDLHNGEADPKDRVYKSRQRENAA